MSNPKFAITFLISAFAGGFILYFMNPKPEIFKPENEKPVACTMDAMQCPNGEWIGRTGPNCEFVCPENNFKETIIQNGTDN